MDGWTLSTLRYSRYNMLPYKSTLNIGLRLHSIENIEYIKRIVDSVEKDATNIKTKRLKFLIKLRSNDS